MKLRSPFLLKASSLVLAGLLCASVLRAQDNSITKDKDDDAGAKTDKPSAQATTRLRIQVMGSGGKPVANASVYVRYNKPGGFLHKDKLAELDLKTNGEGGVKVPPVPQGPIMIQVIAAGWHTFGKWYQIDKDEDSIDIKLEPPTRWY